MKILFLTPWYPDERNPNHGIFVRDQAVAVSREHDVWVVSGKVDYSSFALSSVSRRDSSFARVRESRIVVKRSLPVFNQFNFFLRLALETLKIGREFRPAVIHGNIGYPGAFWAWIMSKLLGVPYVVTEHTRITNNFRSGMHRALTLFGLRRARFVIAVSKWHADEIRDFIGKEVEVIPNVIRFEEIPEPPKKRNTGELQIGFLGGLNTPVKGLDILLKAISQLSGNFKLHIGGDGLLLAMYKDMAADLKVFDKCIFYGRVPYTDVQAFMAKLHVFVSSSRWETFGIAMVEALASGLPVVATNTGGAREFIDNSNGFIVPIDDVDQLREALETVARKMYSYDPKSISTLVRTRFSTDVFVEKVDRLYRASAHSS